MSPQLESVHPVLMSSDVAASARFYVERLGFTLMFQDAPSAPKYAAVRRDGVELHLQWQDADQWKYAIDRPTYRFVVRDVDALFDELQSRGTLSRDSRVRDTPWGTREFHVHDPDRNGLQFYRLR